MVDRLERIGRDPQPHRAPERVGDQRHVQQVRQEPPLGLDVRMADLVADLGALAGQFAASRHNKTLKSGVLCERLPRPKEAEAVWRAKGSLEEPRKYRNGAVRSSDPRGCGPPPVEPRNGPKSRICLDRVKMRRQTVAGVRTAGLSRFDAPGATPGLSPFSGHVGRRRDRQIERGRTASAGKGARKAGAE